jgi:hypothetical protein
MSKFIIIAALTVAVGAFAAPATAHNRVNWYWSPASAQQQLLDDGIEWAEPDGYEYVESARCRGWGKYIISRRNERKLFKHFRCFVNTTIENTGESDAYFMNLHVTGKHTWEAYPSSS